MNNLTNKTPKPGLLAIWAEVAPDMVTEFQEWHNCEHIPERIAIPGFLNGRRYREMTDVPNFLMLYDTQALDGRVTD